MQAIGPLLFRIFYSTTFTVAFLLVLALVVLTPTDAVYQAWNNDNRRYDVGVIVGCYILTALLAILIYASRLYTNRSILQGIPKSYIPIGKDDLPGKVTRKEIVEGLERNAIIAYKARPRFEEVEDASPTASAWISAITHSGTERLQKERTWEHIAHPGWSSPASPDLPNLHYGTVIAELPDLIEAKAVSLAPTNPLLTLQPEENPLPDERVVEVLQRPLNMGLRDYISYLNTLSLITPPTLGAEFLTLYERARFSNIPLDEPSFRKLMSIFASILRGMTRLDPGLVAELQDVDPDQDEDPSDWRTAAAWSPKSASTFSVDDTGSIRHHHPPRRVSEDSVPSLPTDNDEDDEEDLEEIDEDTQSFPTALPPPPPRAASSSKSKPESHDPSSITISSLSRPPVSTRALPLSPQRSLQQTRSNISLASRSSTRSGGSVIRLTEARAMADLPYTIEIPAPKNMGGR